MKLVKVICKKKDGINFPETKAMAAFEKKYRAASVKTGHWHVYFTPEMESRTIRVDIQGPLDFKESFGMQTPDEMKSTVKKYKALCDELEKTIDYAEKKGKELEKEFKTLPSEEK